MPGELQQFWHEVAKRAGERVGAFDPSKAHYVRTSTLFDATAALTVGDVIIQRWDAVHAEALVRSVRAGNVFRRAASDRYTLRAREFSGQTTLQATLAPGTSAVTAREVADRAEQLAFAATVHWVPRLKLQRALAVDHRLSADADLFLGPGLGKASMRTPWIPKAATLRLDNLFVRRFRLCGVERSASLLLRPRGFGAERADRALRWLREARLEVDNDAALIKAVIGLESLFIQERGEPLAHTVSERLAFLLGHDPHQREELYRLGKRIYDARSSIVHSGQAGRVSPQFVDVATRLLLMAVQGVVENATILSGKDSSRQFFDSLRWSGQGGAPLLPFPATFTARLLRAVKA